MSVQRVNLQDDLKKLAKVKKELIEFISSPKVTLKTLNIEFVPSKLPFIVHENMFLQPTPQDSGFRNITLTVHDSRKPKNRKIKKGKKRG